MKRKLLLSIVCAGILVPAAFLSFAAVKSPSHERDWSLDQAVLPEVEKLDAGRFLIKNIRNFRYDDVTSYIPNYYDLELSLEELTGLSYVVVPFSGYVGAAHTMLSFEFSGERFLTVSVEIRKREGQEFSALRGMLNQYEIMYVLADERDVIKLRTHHRGNDVYLYPVRASKEQIARLFVSVLHRVEQIRETPEFYHSLSNNCTTNIISHVNEIAPGTLRSLLVGIMPAYSDRYALRRGLLDTELTDIVASREKYFISDVARKVDDPLVFSQAIRKRHSSVSPSAH